MMQYWVIIGALVNLVGSFFYIRDTLRGVTKPNKVSWLLWSIVPFIATAAGLAEGVRWAVLPVFMSGFTPLLVFLASFLNKQAFWELKWFDYFCGFISVLALGLWFITKEPLVVIILAILADIFAGLPTIIKAWHYPDTETGFTYVAGLFSALTALLAVQVWIFSEYGFVFWLIIANSLLIMGIYRKKLLIIFKN